MGKLKDIKDQVAREKFNTSWDDLLYDMYPDDTYVNDVSRYEIDVLMEEVARRYAKAVAEDALNRAAEGATAYTDIDDTPQVIKSSILSAEINLDL